MLRSFHYIDDKGKDQGINGSLPSSIFDNHVLTVRQCATARRRSQSSLRTWKGSVSSGGRQRRTKASTPASGTTAWRFSRRAAAATAVSARSRLAEAEAVATTLVPLAATAEAEAAAAAAAEAMEAEGMMRVRISVVQIHCAQQRTADYGGYSGGGSSSGGGSGGFRDSAPRSGFDEYDAGDDEAPVRRSGSVRTAAPVAPRSTAAPPKAAAAAAPPPPPPQPLEDLLGGFDDFASAPPAPVPAPAVPAPAVNKALPSLDGSTYTRLVRLFC
jgi:hypothetical protein